MSLSMTRKETFRGWCYLIFQLTLLPVLLQTGSRLLPFPVSSALLNFVFFLLNFLAVLLIFRRFLKENFRIFRHSLWKSFKAVVIGSLILLGSALVLERLIPLISPGYENLNDRGIQAMVRENFLLVAVGTIFLVPPVEECFFRGLIFLRLRKKNRTAAYALSILLFAAIHLFGFLGSYSPLQLLLAFLQYLPAGLVLAWAYEASGNIFAPMFIHALVNLRGIWLMR